jgi:hypothetical protein
MIHIDKALYVDDIGFSSSIFKVRLNSGQSNAIKKYVDIMNNLTIQNYKNNLSNEKLIFYGNDRIKFYTEKIIPTFHSDKIKLMLLFSNPHPKSLIKGMFHSNKSTQSTNFWTYLKKGEIFQFLDTNIDYSTADMFIKGDYESKYQIYFHCFYSFPSPKTPEELKTLFGDEYYLGHLNEKGRDEIFNIINDHSIKAVLCFNQDVFNILRGSSTKGNTKRLDEGRLVKDYIKILETVPIYYIYPTSWYDPANYKDIEKRVVSALHRINKDIIKANRNSKIGNESEFNSEATLWQIFHSPMIKEFREDIIVFSSAKKIMEGDYIVYEILPNKLTGLFKVTKKMHDTDVEYEKRLLSKEILGFPLPYQYKIEPIIKFFKKPLDKKADPELNRILTDKVREYSVKLAQLYEIRQFCQGYLVSISSETATMR